MKKLVLCFVLFSCLLSTTAFADHWKTYRFPCEPDYIISLPSSYHVLYRGMPENSKALSAIGITVEQAEMQMGFNNAFALIYSNNFSSFISISKLDGALGDDYESKTTKELEDLAAFCASAIVQDIQSKENVTLIDFAYAVQETDFAKYLVNMNKIEMGVSKQTMFQCMTHKNGYDTIIALDCLNEDYMEKDVDTFDAILNNLVIL